MCLNNTNPVNILRTPVEISLLEAPKKNKKNLQHIPNNKHDVIALFLPPGALHN
jgi:hypothetical protein